MWLLYFKLLLLSLSEILKLSLLHRSGIDLCAQFCYHKVKIRQFLELDCLRMLYALGFVSNLKDELTRGSVILAASFGTSDE